MSIRVLVVDDSSFIRRAVTRMLGDDPEISVVGEASHGNEAIVLVHSVAPDVITLDLEMPHVGGLDTVRRIMAERPTPIVLLSVHARADADKTLEALAAGAVDFVDKSSVSRMNVHALGDELIRKVRLAALSRPAAIASTSPATAFDASPPGQGQGAVVLGASTGGPAAIARLLGRLPRDFPLPILAVQHMPPGFTHPYAQRLHAAGPLSVKEAEEGDRFKEGVFVAPAGLHATLRHAETGTAIALVPGVSGDLHVPSLDVAATSAARILGSEVCLVVLTGMGSDGLEGARAVHAAGGLVVAQDEASSVIYGMPRAVVRAGLAHSVLPLDRISDLLVRVARRHTARQGVRISG